GRRVTGVGSRAVGGMRVRCARRLLRVVVDAVRLPRVRVARGGGRSLQAGRLHTMLIAVLARRVVRVVCAPISRGSCAWWRGRGNPSRTRRPFRVLLMPALFHSLHLP
ncbi:MAG: hypothetical protein NUV35_09315, partial [Syntrophomonadaceae bacterium]|nr:hypothetical protein [Syntrophomonadaceae bacterium]